VGIPTSAMFECSGDAFGMCNIFFQDNCAGDSREMAIFNNEASTHCCTLGSYCSIITATVEGDDGLDFRAWGHLTIWLSTTLVSVSHGINLHAYLIYDSLHLIVPSLNGPVKVGRHKFRGKGCR